MPIGPEVVRRLAYVRYLHQLGVDQARLPEPLSSASVLMLHDAIEAFLLLAAEHLGEDPPAQFEKYGSLFAGRLPANGLVAFQGMRRLNRVRVGLKHHGAHPSKQTINQAVDDVAAFMNANAPLVFGVEYGEISMSDLISQINVREYVETAEAAIARGDNIVAMMRLRQAFENLFSPHTPQWRHDRESAFAFGASIGPFTLSKDKIRRLLSADSTNSHDAHKLGEQIEDITKIVDKLQTSMRLAVLGISYPAYLRFRNLTPTYFDTMDGTRHWSAHVGYVPDRADFDFCAQFIVTAAVRLAAAEAEISLPDWVSFDDWGRVKWEHLKDEPARPVSSDSQN